MNSILAFLAMLAFAQTPVEFEVASIRPAGPIQNNVQAGVRIDGAQAHFTFLSLSDYVSMAYRVKIHQVSGPDWLPSERFDIAAKIPDGGIPEQIPEMLQALLADRFQMKMHRDKKEFPVYSLEVAKGGLKMQELPPDPEGETDAKGVVNIAAGGSGNGAMVNMGRGTYFSVGAKGFEGKKLAMSRLADMLTRFLDRPVVDMTDLKGNYDFVLELTPEDRNVMLIRSAVTAGVVLPPQALRLLDTPSGDSLSNALQKVGLKLEPRKAPLDILVIDSIQKKPTEN